MNQIEFIKKWAKHGDKIIDGDFKAIIAQDKDRAIFYHFFDPEEADGFNFHSVDHFNARKWQSPKIYRSLDPIEWESKKGYTEGWQVIADYADEKKEESKTLYERWFPDGRETFTHQEAKKIVENVFGEIESRLKALEDKIK